MQKFRFYNQFFPTPASLLMPSFGCDISDESLKYVLLHRNRKGLQVKSHGRLDIPPGILEDGLVKSVEQFTKVLTTWERPYHSKYVRIALPEEQAYVFQVVIDGVAVSELRGAIQLQLEKYVPVSPASVLFDYQVLQSNRDHHVVHVTAVEYAVVNGYTEAFKAAGMIPVSCELEAHALARAVLPAHHQTTTLIADFGSTRTGISIVHKGILRYTSTIDIGGDQITDLLSRVLKIDKLKAETLKFKYGIKVHPDTAAAHDELISMMDKMDNELNSLLQYWRTHHKSHVVSSGDIDEFLFIGGSANLPGLTDWFANTFTQKVTMADPWQKIKMYASDPDMVPQVKKSEALSYAGAIGLALGDYMSNVVKKTKNKKGKSKRTNNKKTSIA